MDRPSRLHTKQNIAARSAEHKMTIELIYHLLHNLLGYMFAAMLGVVNFILAGTAYGGKGGGK